MVQSGSVLIVHVNRTVQTSTTITKDNRLVNSCVSSSLRLPIYADEGVSFAAEYRLVATINHSGSASKGHYWAYILCPKNKGWFMCNDASVSTASPSDVDNGSS